ncbi:MULTISPECIES: hypothetical protein [Streptomyces]|uniref:DUF5753 domain-containing protein n=1 Tax=Streptomyces griseocarneus TaxID=51201 RepID=A0ABX7RSJ8_9ACTN|nr:MULTISPECIES: hypothetical protein [Streptomyces]QSY50200.1 hypothetical protein J3S04_03875 [Streptomyces griseocarneus]
MHDRRDVILTMLDEERGVTAVSMGWLRDQYEPEWIRLSTARVVEIGEWLTQREIRYLPSPLPSRETEEVMLYRPSSLIGTYISAARMEGIFAKHPTTAAYMLGELSKKLERLEAVSDAEH